MGTKYSYYNESYRNRRDNHNTNDQSILLYPIINKIICSSNTLFQDNDINPNTVPVSVTIHRDDEQSLDIPQFEKFYYEFDLNLSTKELKPRDPDSPIKIKTEKIGDNFTLEGGVWLNIFYKTHITLHIS